MSRRYRDDDGWGWVSDHEAWLEAIGATVVFILEIVVLFYIFFTLAGQ